MNIQLMNSALNTELAIKTLDTKTEKYCIYSNTGPYVLVI